MNRTATASLGALLALAARPARADAMPYVFPQSDTAVVYVVGGAAPLRQTLRVSASLGLQRVDAPGGGMAVITDTVRRTMTVLDETAHTFSQGAAPPGTADMRGRRAPGDYVRDGDATVAGLSCTEWSTHDPAGHAVTVCLTADGVLLRARAGTQTLVEASSVDHATQDPALFQAPSAWRRIAR